MTITMDIIDRAKKTRLAGLALAFLAVGLPAHATDCYILKSAEGETLYSSGRPPFDLSYPPFSRQYEASRARGEHLIITTGNECFHAEEFERQMSEARGIIYRRKEEQAARAAGVSVGSAFSADPYSVYSASPDFRPRTKFVTVGAKPKPPEPVARDAPTGNAPWGTGSYLGAAPASPASAPGHGGYKPPPSQPPPPTNAPGYGGYVPPSPPAAGGGFSSSPPSPRPNSSGSDRF